MDTGNNYAQAFHDVYENDERNWYIIFRRPNRKHWWVRMTIEYLPDAVAKSAASDIDRLRVYGPFDSTQRVSTFFGAGVILGDNGEYEFKEYARLYRVHQTRERTRVIAIDYNVSMNAYQFIRLSSKGYLVQGTIFYPGHDSYVRIVRLLGQDGVVKTDGRAIGWKRYYVVDTRSWDHTYRHK